MYRCVAVSEAAFVQQLSVSYVGHGYVFYVTGTVPKRKDPPAVDQKLIRRYAVDVSKHVRARRKRGGLANVHYLRFERFFVLCATEGEHRFFVDETEFRDARRDPIVFRGYSIGYKRDPEGKWHPSVRIHPRAYAELKASLLDVAVKRDVDEMVRLFRGIRFQPYAPIRTQLLAVWRAVNATRREAGLEEVPKSAVGLRRTPLIVFGRVEEDDDVRDEPAGDVPAPSG
jgi:hypothetical protein